MKKILLFLFLLVAVIFFTSSPAKTKVKSYYSGDAINYKERLVVASTDSEALEIFTLEKDGLKRQIKIRPFDNRFNKEDSFYSVKLNIENDKLYAYAISGYTIYKYDISELKNYYLIREMKNTYWEWYNKIDKFGDNIATVSSKGVKIYNNNLEVIDSYDLTNDTPYNISSGGSKSMIFSFDEKSGQIKVFEKDQRKVTKNLNINFYGGKNNRNVYFDTYDNHIYLADDRSVKKVALNGSLKGTFEHLGYPGYDVSSSGNEYLYFANGLGVVRLKKSDMSVVSSKRTGNITVAEGWAMGLRVVNTKAGERVIIFNNSSIIVMNGALEVLGYAVAEKDNKVYPQENLYLNLNSATFVSGTQIQVSGGGYLPNERLFISFYNQKYELSADSNGRFTKVLNAPSLVDSNSRNKVFSQDEVSGGMAVSNISERTDIKVEGQASKYSYSISLEIKDTMILNK